MGLIYLSHSAAMSLHFHSKRWTMAVLPLQLGSYWPRATPIIQQPMAQIQMAFISLWIEWNCTEKLLMCRRSCGQRLTKTLSVCRCVRHFISQFCLSSAVNSCHDQSSISWRLYKYLDWNPNYLLCIPLSALGLTKNVKNNSTDHKAKWFSHHLFY